MIKGSDDTIQPEVISSFLDPLNSNLLSIKLVYISCNLQTFLILFIDLKHKLHQNLIAFNLHTELNRFDLLKEILHEGGFFIVAFVKVVIQVSQHKTKVLVYVKQFALSCREVLQFQSVEVIVAFDKDVDVLSPGLFFVATVFLLFLDYAKIEKYVTLAAVFCGFMPLSS